MKINVQLFGTILMALLGPVRAEPASADATSAKLERVQAMQRDLDRDGLWNFLDTVRAKGWSAPWIHSDYWVGRLPEKPEDRVELEKAQRALGLSIAKAFDAEALKLMQPADSATREAQAKSFLDAADWLRKSRGYGNLLLVTRAENLAYIPIGYLVADLTCSTNTIDALMKRIGTPEEDLAFRLAVLDEEAPVPLAVRKGESLKETNDRLELAWNLGYHAMKTWCKDQGMGRAKDRESRRRIPAAYAFFADDEASQPPFTTVNKWDQKQHHSCCVYGCDTGIRQRIDTLHLFRLQVGSFPTNPPAWFGPQEKKYTAIEAAFIQAWEEPFYSTYGPIGQLAGRVYESIRANRLLDWETAQLVEASETAVSQPEKK